MSQYWKLLTKHCLNPQKYKLPENGKYWIDKHKEEFSHLSRTEAFYLFRNNLSEPPKHNCGERLSFDEKTYKYRKSCPACGRKAHNATKVSIDGVEYDSKQQARERLGLSVYELDKRLGDDVIQKYSRNGLISKEILLDRVNKRKTMASIREEFFINHESLKFLFDYYQIPTKWNQLEAPAYEFLEDKHRFEQEFKESNSEELAVKYNCSPSTILQWANKYNIDRTERFQSAIERTLIDYIKSLDESLIVEARNTDAIGMEIDIFIPSKMVGIELDGLFYHCDPSPLYDRNKHLEKQKLAYKKSVTLLRFVDIGETKHKLDIVKSIIRAKLGYNEKVYARKCKIVEVDSKTARSFFLDNHISGNANASVFVGLEYQGVLVELCSFAKPRFDKLSKWELIRLASKQGVTVVGGLSRIIKYFRQRHSGPIMTYANLRFGGGNGYKKVGFSYIGCTGAGYFYTDMVKIYSRHMFRKDTIIRTIPGADITKSEAEIAYEHGFKRYRDCGHAKFILT